ncbi:alkylhydroperoxidase/carboxymuconolactone decarboxylase family protein YurZ [Agromyces terreus]|uniref:Alkylhydroperoxidase/carboxymuconolactone decarboxylase family protein YurZ n=1 Tax=Agromyces terreus TaxID=424795 RepID=A0A9X2KG70_9MICO|nr:carboxymuconolactone decarboxylase family protein [Agromyces terreus]MCP2372537.1 alkylhydroperoxidase/carboxymuconolactone decarboxylase family protein YurZ [Agromyces terreus]
MDYLERLRRLCVDDELPGDADEPGSSILDPRAYHLVRLAALVAMAAAEPSIRSEVDDAIGVGVRPDEIVDVLSAVTTVAGRPRVVSAAPRIASALGEDLDLLANL